MCLHSITEKPYNKLNTRWKVFKVLANGKLSSPFHDNNWKVNSTKRCVDPGHLHSWDIGFHVVLTKADAADVVREIAGDSWSLSENEYLVLAKVRVERFNSAGIWGYYGPEFKSETWKRCTILQVFTAAGRTDITSRFA